MLKEKSATSELIDYTINVKLIDFKICRFYVAIMIIIRCKMSYPSLTYYLLEEYDPSFGYLFFMVGVW